jgi:hypothetical protein
MEASKIDKAVMLLSADWFLPHWSKLGISFTEEDVVPFQRGCRKIVTQIMSGATKYWDVEFSGERLERTRFTLKTLTADRRASARTTHSIDRLIGEAEGDKVDRATGWLLLSITRSLVSDSDAHIPQPDSKVRNIICEAWNLAGGSESDEVSFQELCLNSKSKWDEYLRNTTPDLPTFLADYLSDLLSTHRFEIFWESLNAALSPVQKQDVVTWYQRAAELRTGGPLRLP